MTENVVQLPQLNTAGALTMGNGSGIGSTIYPHNSHGSIYTNGSTFTNGSIPPIHARAHSREDSKFDGSITPENQDTLYEEQQQELKSSRAKKTSFRLLLNLMARSSHILFTTPGYDMDLILSLSQSNTWNCSQKYGIKKKKKYPCACWPTNTITLI